MPIAGIDQLHKGSYHARPARQVFIPKAVGTPQGSFVSPILANIYLHETLDLWLKENYENGFKRMARYADDVVFCFKREEDAQDFYQAYRRSPKSSMTWEEFRRRLRRSPLCQNLGDMSRSTSHEES